MLFVYIGASIIGIIIIIIVGAHLYSFFLYPSLRPKEAGFEYVHVDYDGSVRELYEEEKKELKRKYPGGDSGRPYIKYKYEEKTPDGKISGYIPRRRVPKEIPIIKKDRSH